MFPLSPAKLLALSATNPIYLLYQLGLDYRPEVIAADLVTRETFPLGQLVFQPIGSITRAYAKDTSAPQQLVASTPASPYLLLPTPREGLYDQLPPFLFHAIPTITASNNPEIVLTQLRQERQIEQETRKFFLPFDTEFHYLRLLRYEYERRTSELAASALLHEEFAAAWPIIERLEPDIASLFVQVLPVIHRLRGNLPWLAQFLAIVFAVPFDFQTEQPNVQASIAVAPSLGLAQLGINAVLGSTFTDDYSVVHLHVGPVPTSRAAEFLPESIANQLLSELLAYFIPATLEVRRFNTVEQTDCILQAKTASGMAETYLGYNSYLATTSPKPRLADYAEIATTYLLALATTSLATCPKQPWPVWSPQPGWHW